MDENNNIVSIIIPVYNGANYVREAIESALNQTYKKCEVIVVNDGSTDNGDTEKIVKSYGDKVRYFYKKNGGVSSALNYGIERMKGSYFSWLSHDDIYEKDKIEKQITLLTKFNAHDAIALCEVKTIDKNSNNISSVQKKRNLSCERINGWEDVLKDLLNNGSFYGCALLIPKNIITECGEFREDLRYCQDYLMWLKIVLSHADFIYTREKLVSLRIHDGQLTQTGRSVYHKEIKEVAEEIMPLLAESSDEEKNYVVMFAKSIAKYNNPDIVKKCISYAKNNKLFPIKEMIPMLIYIVYGKVRPVIRKIYYQVFRRVKTS